MFSAYGLRLGSVLFLWVVEGFVRSYRLISLSGSTVGVWGFECRVWGFGFGPGGHLVLSSLSIQVQCTFPENPILSVKTPILPCKPLQPL